MGNVQYETFKLIKLYLRIGDKKWNLIHIIRMIILSYENYS